MVKFYYKDFNLLKCTPESDDTEIIVPKGIFMIDKNAFRGCGSIKRIVIPNGVKSLDCTFCDCVSLEELVIPTVKHLTVQDFLKTARKSSSVSAVF